MKNSILFIFLLVGCYNKTKSSSVSDVSTDTIIIAGKSSVSIKPNSVTIYDNTHYMDSLDEVIRYQFRMMDTLDYLRNQSIRYAIKHDKKNMDYWDKKADAYAAKFKAKYVK